MPRSEDIHKTLLRRSPACNGWIEYLPKIRGQGEDLTDPATEPLRSKVLRSWPERENRKAGINPQLPKLWAVRFQQDVEISISKIIKGMVAPSILSRITFIM
jgi:hypothetical protein